MKKTKHYPFTAILGQDAMKEALLLNVIDPSLGGVLIRGQKGTAKSTAVRALSDAISSLKIVNLPINATEDRVAGTLDVEHAIKTGEKKFEKGILAQADKNILYVDEINLLDDHIVDLLLDAAACGVNSVERDGISYSHPARFILVGTMNPEEGSLRPQLLDRFPMVVDVEGETDLDTRIQIIEHRLAYEEDPSSFCKKFAKSTTALRKQIKQAVELLPQVKISREILALAVQIGLAYETEGHRSDISMIKTAKTLAAYHGRRDVTTEDLRRAALYTLPHRMRKAPLDNKTMDPSILSDLLNEASSQGSGDAESSEGG